MLRSYQYIFGVFILAFLPAVFGSAEAQGISIEAEVTAGAAAYKNGDLMGALRHYHVAADAGSPVAQARLGWIYDRSEENETAYNWYRLSAEQGHADGEFGLAEMYAKGEGIAKDLDEAVAWFERAAQHGHERAMRVLENAYRKGSLGREIDNVRADAWQNKLDALAVPEGAQ